MFSDGPEHWLSVVWRFYPRWVKVAVSLATLLAWVEFGLRYCAPPEIEAGWEEGFRLVPTRPLWTICVVLLLLLVIGARGAIKEIRRRDALRAIRVQGERCNVGYQARARETPDGTRQEIIRYHAQAFLRIDNP